jgi:hypothetical protein
MLDIIHCTNMQCIPVEAERSPAQSIIALKESFQSVGVLCHSVRPLICRLGATCRRAYRRSAPLHTTYSHPLQAWQPIRWEGSGPWLSLILQLASQERRNAWCVQDQTMLVIILRQLPHQLYNYTVVYSQAYRQRPCTNVWSRNTCQ